MTEKDPAKICEAARTGNLDAVRSFIAARPDAVNEADANGFTPLHQSIIADSCGNINFELVKFLVHSGAPLNALSRDGRSPLWLAAEFCPSVEIVQYLINQGADLDTLASRPGCGHVIDCIDGIAEQKAVQALLSRLSGHPLPVPPPPPKYPDERAGTATWRKATAAVKKAFAELEAAGIVALPNAGYTVGEGIAECCERLESRPDAAHFTGYCFYTEPSKDYAREYGMLNLHFGTTGENGSDTAGIAHQTVALLRQHGLDAEWDGNPDHCITAWLQPLYARLQAA